MCAWQLSSRSSFLVHRRLQTCLRSIKINSSKIFWITSKTSQKITGNVKKKLVFLCKNTILWEYILLLTTLKYPLTRRDFLIIVNCVKGVHIRGFSAPFFLAYRLNIKINRVNIRFQSKCWKIRTKKTRYTDTFHAVVLI